MKKVILIFFLLILCQFSYASEDSNQLAQELRENHRFGIGTQIAGTLGVMGLIADINISSNMSIAGGIGTGFDYNSYMLKYRYLLLAKKVHPYFGIAYNQWSSSSPIAKPSKVSPQFLVEKFLTPEELENEQGFAKHFLTPLFGVQYLSPVGLSIFAELNLMADIFTFTSNFYWSIGFMWYF